MEKYLKGDVIGEGTFAEVYAAKNLETEQHFAVKKFKYIKESNGIHLSIIRELSLLQEIHHPNIMHVVDVYIDSEKDFFVVYELMASDLCNVLRGLKNPLSFSVRKTYLQMILNAVSCLHSNSIIHRDIKPENFLIGNDRSLKLTDFGSAKSMDYSDVNTMTPSMFSRWYSPPEVLMDSHAYAFSADIWSVGCILAHMLKGNSPVFCGATDLSQLSSIFEFFELQLTELDPSSLMMYNQEVVEKKDFIKAKWMRLFSHANEKEVDLLFQLLCLDPSGRPSAGDALKHPCFTTTQPPPASLSELPDPYLYEKIKKKNRKMDLTHPLETVPLVPVSVSQLSSAPCIGEFCDDDDDYT